MINFLRRLILVFAYIAGGAIILMMIITIVDVIMRLFGTGITGAYDLVRACGVIAVSCALPYVTAVKGHIAIEYFYQKFGNIGRILLDTVFRILSIIIFGILAVYTFKHGLALIETGELFPNLGLPVFWIPFLISLNSILMITVFLFHLKHPGKEFIKP